MMTRHQVGKFLLRFALIFGVLIVPWPGWNQIYAHYFQGLGQMAFSRAEGKRAVVISSEDGSQSSSGLDTQITLANRELLDASGKGLMKRTEINSRSIGWVPTALTLALIGATPIPWWRLLWALSGGLVLVHAFILFSLQTWIWNNSPDVSLLNLPTFWKTAADDLDYELMNQLGASFTVPVLIWVLVTFRGQDRLNKR